MILLSCLKDATKLKISLYGSCHRDFIGLNSSEQFIFQGQSCLS